MRDKQLGKFSACIRVVLAIATIASLGFAGNHLVRGDSVGSGAKTPSNPEAGMTDAQREALHRQGWDDFKTKDAAWLKSLDISSLPLNTLPRGYLNDQTVAPEPTLAAAIGKADVIVVGTVKGIRPTPFAGTDVTMSVDQTLKGTPLDAVVFSQAGGLYPGPDWKGVTIGSSISNPLLLPGDRALLFLHRVHGGTLEVQGFSGYYKITQGTVAALPLNPFGSQLNGRPEAVVVGAIKSSFP